MLSGRERYAARAGAVRETRGAGRGAARLGQAAWRLSGLALGGRPARGLAPSHADYSGNVPNVSLTVTLSGICHFDFRLYLLNMSIFAAKRNYFCSLVGTY